MKSSVVILIIAALVGASVALALDFKAFNIDGLAKGNAASKAVEKYGQPEKQGKPQFWAGSGDWHAQYKWPSKGIVIDMVAENENAKAWTINEITATAPFAGKTDKGVGIGADAAEVIKTYGKPAVQNKQKIQFSEGECCTLAIFFLKSGKVEKIWIGPTPE